MNTRHIFSILFFFIFSKGLYAQARAFRDFIVAAGSATNPTILKDNFKAFGGQARFVSDYWLKGEILGTQGEVVNDKYEFNYDYLENDLYLREEKAVQSIVLTNSHIKKFKLFLPDGSDTLVFVKYIGLDPKNKQFYQLLAGSTIGKIALLKLKTIEQIPANKTSYVNNFNGTYQDTYRETIVYYVLDDKGKVHTLNRLLRKNITDLYPHLKEKANAFMKKTTLTDQQAAQLVQYLEAEMNVQ
jgi:hypothetical protein